MIRCPHFPEIDVQLVGLIQSIITGAEPEGETEVEVTTTASAVSHMSIAWCHMILT